ncbi:LacI family DNA-binding transcriptional regulator [Pseudochryseolinea flava]|uniref:LacI family transcriptional regulator n=1 Tax=Pseudochryseolinea flava TaxID=2059302 RepID=A0A364XY10_9BACT|nr:substrate-binding domain-containing protein [Pseudochryseolinea flava]RAV99175.1 LacI family transcriptional regulator [Pseudochryseolinea flava]
MKKGKLSINDIAAKLNISKTTVSFILNGKAKEKRISEELTKKVQNLVDKVGYTPSQAAQSLRTGRTGIIGLMVEDISDPFFSGVAKHIEDEAFLRGYKIIYCSTENDKKRTQEYLRMFNQLRVDGYIITAPDNAEDDVEKLYNEGKQIILFDRNFKDIPLSYVMINNEKSTIEGTRHLIENGFKKIAFITLDSDQPQMVSRGKGYEKAIKEAKLSKHMLKMNYSLHAEDYIEQITTYLRTTSLDAVFFATGYLGICGLEALKGLKMSIPKDVGMVSFDDTDLFRIHTPSITAIPQPIAEMSTTLINTLLDNIEKPTSSRQKKVQHEIVLGTAIIVRESSKRK